MSVELAKKFHDTYERLAPQFRYETRGDTKRFDPETPNGRLMIAVCSEVLSEYGAEIERLKKIAEIFNTVAEERSVALREVDQLTREVRYLRHYGNKDCTYQADQAMANDELEDK